MRWPLLLLAVLLVNLPAAHQRWTDHQVAERGEDVQAVVVDLRSSGGSNLVDYRLPAEVDPAQRLFSAAVDDAAYARAERTDQLLVRTIPGEPGSNRPAGEVGNPLLLLVAVGADVILVVVAALLWWRRRRRAADGPDLYDLA